LDLLDETTTKNRIWYVSAKFSSLPWLFALEWSNTHIYVSKCPSW